MPGKKNLGNLRVGSAIALLVPIIIALKLLFSGIPESSEWFSGLENIFSIPNSVKYEAPYTCTQLPPPQDAQEFGVKRVVDGDTLLLENGTRVRLIGVDTPETVRPKTPVQPYGTEASAFTKNKIREYSNRVRLTYDREKKDKYGRTLAYVWVGDEFLNESLLRNGFARATLNYPFSSDMKKRFKNAQEQAVQEKRGLWAL